jgi:SAM-dependent methyltransferase
MSDKNINISKDFNPSILHPNYLTRKNLLNGIRKFSPRLDGKLLDFGCGSKPYRDLFKVSEYVGLDFENTGHPHLNEQIDVFYDGKNIPFPDDHFDSVFSSEVFEHIFNLPEILQELNRILKPGGKLLITCPFAICEHEVPNDFARYSSFGIRHLLESRGFKVLALEKSGTAIETIWQLRVMNWHQNILPKVKNIPLLRGMLRNFIFLYCNGFAKLENWIFPDSFDLYLNNIVLAEKEKRTQV